MRRAAAGFLSAATTTDPEFANVVLLMHMDDTGLTDVKGHTVALNGGATRSATRSKFGGYSAFCDGVNDYIQITNSPDFNFGTGNFTIECWVSLGASGAMIATRNFGAAVNGCWNLNITATVTDFIPWNITGGTAASASYSSIGTAWTHVAAVRNGTEFAVYVNGVKGGLPRTSALSMGYANENILLNTLYIGVQSYFNSYIDELRITKGVARYTANFTPPTERFPDA